MPTIYIKNGTKQPATPPKPNTETKGVCNERQRIINEIVSATQGVKNKAVLKTLANVSLLGVINGIAPAPEFAGQPICMRRASAINQFRAIRGQLKEINNILTKNGL